MWNSIITEAIKNKQLIEVAYTQEVRLVEALWPVMHLPGYHGHKHLPNQ